MPTQLCDLAAKIELIKQDKAKHLMISQMIVLCSNNYRSRTRFIGYCWNGIEVIFTFLYSLSPYLDIGYLSVKE